MLRRVKRDAGLASAYTRMCRPRRHLPSWCLRSLFSNTTGTSVQDARARGIVWTRLPVPRLTSPSTSPGLCQAKVTSRSRWETRPFDVRTRTWRFPIIFQGKTVRNSHFMNSVFTFDNFRFASYLRIAFIPGFISCEYGFVAVVWPSPVSESCQNFCLRFWVGYVEAPVSALANKDKS